MTYTEQLRHFKKSGNGRILKHHPLITCIKCNHKKIASKFWLQRKNRKPTNVCKDCYRLQNKKWMKNNPEKVKSYSQKWYASHPEHNHKHKLMYRYGLSLEDYKLKLNQQNGVCSICKKPESKASHHKHLSVDHDHITGKNRGLLCDECNKGLGNFNDSVEILNNAIQYLYQWI